MRSSATLWLSLLLLSAYAEQLPVKIFRSADGLAHESVHGILRDSHGYVWFATSEGLSRFDGYQFVNFGTREGLPNRAINSLVESADGLYWVATANGLYQFDAKTSEHKQPFGQLPLKGDAGASFVYSIAADGGHGVWVGTVSGVFHFDGYALTEVDLGQAFPELRHGGPEDAAPRVNAMVRAILRDRAGGVWFGARSGVMRRARDGHITFFSTAGGLSANPVYSLLEDRAGNVWAGTESGLAELGNVAGDGTLQPFSKRTWKTPPVQALAESTDGSIWLGTGHGLLNYANNKSACCDGLRSYSIANGLSDDNIEAIAADRDGNLWLGTDGGGAMRIALKGFSTFVVADGLPKLNVASLLLDREGRLQVVTRDGQRLAAAVHQGLGFKNSGIPLPPDLQLGWGWDQIVLQDHTGDWWFASDDGLIRVHGNSRKVYRQADGLSGRRVFRIFEDSRGNIWASTFTDNGGNGLSRWDRQSNTFTNATAEDGLGPLGVQVMGAMAEDRAGNIWFGMTKWGGILRYRGGRFTYFGKSLGVPENGIRKLFLDSKGHLWAATNVNGLLLIDDPTADRPTVTNYSTENGLSGNQVHSITEDLLGRLYICTSRGIDRIANPAQAGAPDARALRPKHYTVNDGLAPGEVQLALRDSEGDLWFGTQHGLSRLRPELETPAPPPTVTIQSLRIGGIDQRLPLLGSQRIDGPAVDSDQNHIEIEFAAVSHIVGESPQYQYRLDGAERAWSAASTRRSVNYARLEPGHYHFLVRALNSSDRPSLGTASVGFQIRAPFWQRWWFNSLAALTLIAVVSLAYRFRVAHLIYLERVRARIAADLHDDIGSGLSQIAILSDLASRQASNAATSQSLTRIGIISGELVDSMSDIVWAIHPGKDHLSDLKQRMRRFTSDLLSSKNITLHWEAASSEGEDLPLSPDMRREVYFAFKECIHNLARHAHANHATIKINVDRQILTIQISDDGTGFDSAQPSSGHGMKTIADRMRRIGGSVDLKSSFQRGTSVKLVVGLRKQVVTGRLSGL